MFTYLTAHRPVSLLLCAHSQSLEQSISANLFQLQWFIHASHCRELLKQSCDVRVQHKSFLAFLVPPHNGQPHWIIETSSTSFLSVIKLYLEFLLPSTIFGYSDSVMVETREVFQNRKKKYEVSALKHFCSQALLATEQVPGAVTIQGKKSLYPSEKVSIHEIAPVNFQTILC